MTINLKKNIKRLKKIAALYSQNDDYRVYSGRHSNTEYYVSVRNVNWSVKKMPKKLKKYFKSELSACKFSYDTKIAPNNTDENSISYDEYKDSWFKDSGLTAHELFIVVTDTEVKLSVMFFFHTVEEVTLTEHCVLNQKHIDNLDLWR